jgi:hypothetical protein
VNTPDFTTILIQAATLSPRPDRTAVMSALQQAEVTAKKEKLAIPFDELLGEWRLLFSSGTKKSQQRRGITLGKGFYLPNFLTASITFIRDRASTSTTIGTAMNQLKIGGLLLKFTGPCRYPGKKNLLIFDFTEIQVSLFGMILYQGKIRSGKTGEKSFEELSIAKLPFFSFFWADPNGIAARGRGGGLAMWVRDK